ncbi:DNA-processing protein DprA [Microbacterium paludicola]|uniref:DNA-processing protein DprA n=1 Tax=Microbacterium paludicola TaxID=300019 RepID=UPI00387A2C3E
MSGTGLERREAAVVVALRGTADLPRLTPVEVRAALEDGRDPVDVLRGTDLVNQLIDVSDELERAADEIRQWRASGLDVMFPFTDDYPQPLLQVYDYPPILFGRGTHAPDFEAVAIVGSRGAASSSLRLAYEAAERLADQGVTVVSGLARGIDTAAHRGALVGSGRTVAVLGQGPGTPIYPKENAPLARAILDHGGQTLSQFWPGSPQTKQTFPIRNVTMSGLSAVTAIVEASETSGTRHQAAAAVRHGRRLLIHDQVAERTTWGREYLDRGLATSFIDVDTAVSAALELLRAISPAETVFA